MALKHTFIMKSISETSIDNYNNESIHINDDTIIYIADSLKWITTQDQNKVEKRGLNYHGISVIERNNIIKMCNIIYAWINLFKNAPDAFELPVEFDLDDAEFIYNVFYRETLIKELLDLYNLCKKALEQNCELVHFGI